MWTSIIKKIKDTDAVSSEILNAPITQLSDRTEFLRVILDNLTTNEFNYVRNVSLDRNTVVGQAVYYDINNKVFSSTLAKWSDTLTSFGSLQPAPSSIFAGILVEKFTEQTGAIIINGYIKGFNHLSVLFGTSSPEAGIYYLSDSSEGKVTSIQPAMAAMALIYDGLGNILLPAINYDHSTHDHKKYLLLTTQWLSANATNFPEISIPSGATFGYDISVASDEIKAAFNLYPGTASFSLYDSGTLLKDVEIFVNADTVWITTSIPTENISMYLSVPNSHGPNIVRSITTNTSDYLDISMSNGVVTINNKETGIDPDVDTGYMVVKDLVSNRVKKGLVVSKIVPGDGININSSDTLGHGEIEINLTEFTDRLIDASIINLNNAIELSSNGKVFTAFPGNRESTMVGVVNLPKWGIGTRRLKMFIWVKGAEGVANAPIPEFTVNIYKYNKPTSTTGEDVYPSAVTKLIPEGTTATSPTKYYERIVDIASDLLVESEAQVQYELKLSAISSADYLIVRQGVLLYKV